MMNQAKRIENKGWASATHKQSQRAAIRELKEGRNATMAVGRWSRYLAAREAAEGGVFGESLSTGVADKGAWAAFARETFATAYGLGDSEGELDQTERPAGTEWVAKLHEHVASLPEWAALCARVAGDPWAAGLASAGVIDAAQEAVQPPTSDLQGLQDEVEFIKDLGGNKLSPKQLRRLAVTNRKLKSAQDEADAALAQATHAGAEIRTALREAIVELNTELDEMDQAMRGLGAGDGAGMMSRVSAPRQQLRDALARNPKLLRVAQLAGRMKVRAIAKQRSKARPGAEVLCDVTTGNDLARLVPSELVNLADETMEALLFRRLSERAATCYELRGREQKAQGPIVMVVDESCSMTGAPDEMAKATALTLMELAARQNRAFAYVRFASSLVGTDLFEQPKSLKLADLEGFVSRFNGGGTSISSGLREAERILKMPRGPWKRADVVLVTDGESSDHREQVAAVKAMRAMGAHVYGVAIGRDARISKEVADETIVLANVNQPEKLEAVFTI